MFWFGFKIFFLLTLSFSKPTLTLTVGKGTTSFDKYIYPNSNIPCSEIVHS
jgi:hypothetical protein